MSGWITPKTDWTPEDYINVEDYVRISNNLKYLKELAEMMVSPLLNWTSVKTDLTYESIQATEDWNAVEENLESLYENLFIEGAGNKTNFYANGPMINYSELNRVESALQWFYQRLTGQYECLKTLAFTLGKDVFE